VKVIIDTSVWSLALRPSDVAEPPPVIELRTLIADGRAQVIGPIRQEILSGIKDEHQFERLRDRLVPFPDLLLQADDYVQAAAFFNACRVRGIQGSNTDFLICSAAVNHRMSIFTTDLDFEKYASQLPVRLHVFA
jgi:predicted nucleic acid-binding protein